MKTDEIDRCPYIGECGGCTLDRPYGDQLDEKQFQIEKLLSWYGPVYPIIGSRKAFRYRCKVNWEYGCDSRGRQFDGIYKAGGHFIVPMDDCLLHDRCAQLIINDINAYCQENGIPYYDEVSGQGFLRHVLIRRSPAKDQTMVVLVTGMWKFQHKDRFIEYLVGKHRDIVTILQNRNKEHTSMILSDEDERVLYGPGYIEDEMCGLTFRISAKSFAQVNPYQAAELYNVAMDMADFRGGETVIDAYCGTGTVGLIAAANGAGKVMGIELNPKAVEDAERNAEINGIKNAQFVCADASEYLKQMAKDGKTADVVILDPPRNGTDERFLSSVFRLGPKKIIYISCNQFTLNRDLRYIVHFSDYRVRAIQPVDMFPQTEHVETVVLMSRGD